MEEWSRTHILDTLSPSIERIRGKNQNWVWKSWLRKSKLEQLVFLLASPQVKMAARAFLGVAHQEIIEGSQEILMVLLCPEELVMKFQLMERIQHLTISLFL